jgi:hypothetical protein
MFSTISAAQTVQRYTPGGASVPSSKRRTIAPLPPGRVAVIKSRRQRRARAGGYSSSSRVSSARSSWKAAERRDCAASFSNCFALAACSSAALRSVSASLAVRSALPLWAAASSRCPRSCLSNRSRSSRRSVIVRRIRGKTRNTSATSTVTTMIAITSTVDIGLSIPPSARSYAPDAGELLQRIRHAAQPWPAPAVDLRLRTIQPAFACRQHGHAHGNR